MRIEQVMPFRYEFYDRAAGPQLLNMNLTGVAPHSQTDRIVDSVLPGYTYMLHSIYIFVRRVTAASTVGNAIVRVYITAGGTEREIFRVWHDDNTVGSIKEGSLVLNMPLIYGWGLKVTTQDDSTGGTVSYLCSITATAFL